jgi:DNA repair exonuclease SbcCD nuclease subunit
LIPGDFWHERGKLPVKILNAVIAEMKQWTQPTILLVGNHDQIPLGGLEHALTPVAVACPNVVRIDKPSVFMGALWGRIHKSWKKLCNRLLVSKRCLLMQMW